MNRSTDESSSPVTRREYEELTRRVSALRRKHRRRFVVDVLATAIATGVVFSVLEVLR